MIDFKNISDLVYRTKRDSFVNSVISMAKSKINSFCVLLGYYPDDYSLALNFNYDFGTFEGKDETVQYNPDTNTVIFNEALIKETLNKIDKIINDKENLEDINLKNRCDKLIEKAYIAYSEDLIHEMFHVLTRVDVTDKLTLDNIKQLSSEEMSKFQFGHSLEQYDLLLGYMLAMPYANEFEIYIPIKLFENEDKTFNVVVYNKIFKRYEFYEHVKFDNVINKDEDLFYKIGKEFNGSQRTFVPSLIIDSSITRIPGEEKKKNVSAYYSRFKGYLLTQEDVDKIVTSDDLDDVYDQRALKVETEIKYQEFIDESITEALTLIAIRAVENQNFDLEVINSSIRRDKNIQLDVKMASALITAIGTEFIFKFISSSKTNITYFDCLYDFLQEDYSHVLYLFSRLVAGVDVIESFVALDNIITRKSSARK